MKTPPETTIATAVSEAPMIELNEEEPKETQKQSLVASRDWDAEESYLLAKIAMAEAEGEDTEGKALVHHGGSEPGLEQWIPGFDRGSHPPRTKWDTSV